MTVEVKTGYFDCWHCIVPFGQGRKYEKITEIKQWCRDTFAKGRWGFEDLYKDTSFILYSKEDVTLFVLRWS